MKTSFLAKDEGNVLLESVGFVAVAFGVVFLAGIQLFEAQADAMALTQLARNSLRYHLVSGNQDLTDAVHQLMLGQSRWSDKTVDISISCIPDCISTPRDIRLRLVSGQSEALAFGIVNE